MVRANSLSTADSCLSPGCPVVVIEVAGKRVGSARAGGVASDLLRSSSIQPDTNPNTVRGGRKSVHGAAAPLQRRRPLPKPAVEISLWTIPSRGRPRTPRGCRFLHAEAIRETTIADGHHSSAGCVGRSARRVGDAVGAGRPIVQDRAELDAVARAADDAGVAVEDISGAPPFGSVGESENRTGWRTSRGCSEPASRYPSRQPRNRHPPACPRRRTYCPSPDLRWSLL